MFLYDIHNTSTRQTGQKEAFESHRSKLYTNVIKSLQTDAVYGFSKYWRHINHYSLAFNYVELIYDEIRLLVETEWDYYEDKYDYKEIRKRFQKYGIDINVLLNGFGVTVGDNNIRIIPYTDMVLSGEGDNFIRIDDTTFLIL